MADRDVMDDLHELLEEATASIPGATFHIEGDTDAAIESLAALIAGQVVPFFRDEDLLIVPIDGGSRDVLVAAIELDGIACVALTCWLQIDVPHVSETVAVVESAMRKINEMWAPQARWVSEDAVGLQLVIPMRDLTASALFDAITLIGRSAARSHEFLAELDAGEPAPPLWSIGGGELPTDAWQTIA